MTGLLSFTIFFAMIYTAGLLNFLIARKFFNSYMKEYILDKYENIRIFDLILEQEVSPICLFFAGIFKV